MTEVSNTALDTFQLSAVARCLVSSKLEAVKRQWCGRAELLPAVSPGLRRTIQDTCSLLSATCVIRLCQES